MPLQFGPTAAIEPLIVDATTAATDITTADPADAAAIPAVQLDKNKPMSGEEFVDNEPANRKPGPLELITQKLNQEKPAGFVDDGLAAVPTSSRCYNVRAALSLVADQLTAENGHQPTRRHQRSR